MVNSSCLLPIMIAWGWGIVKCRVGKMGGSLYRDNCRPLTDAMLRIAWERIATPVCALVRNDRGFVTRSTILVAESKITLSLRGAAIPRKAATWQSVFPVPKGHRRPSGATIIPPSYHFYRGGTAKKAPAGAGAFSKAAPSIPRVVL